MAYSSCDIRNVCLVGPSGAGKTQLTEALLHAGGAVPEMGSVIKGNTVSDHTAREREQVARGLDVEAAEGARR